MYQKMFIFGLDSAGKTTILNFMKYGEVKPTVPTLAFNITTLNFPDFDLQVWDAPGQRNLRRIWNNGFNKAKLMVFILDLADKERFEESAQEFHKVLEEEDTAGMPVIFCYHKIDIDSAKDNMAAAKDLFKISEIKDRDFVCIETSVYQDATINSLKMKILEFLAQKSKPYIREIS